RLIGVPYRVRLEHTPWFSGGFSQKGHVERTARIRRLPKNCHTRVFGIRPLQQLKPLAAELVAEEERNPREIAAGPGQTGDEPQSQGIARDEDNWDRGGRILRRQGRR